MLRLFHLFIDILTTGSFHLLCKEDVRELGLGFERYPIKDSQSLWGQDLPRIKRLFLLAGDNLKKALISSFLHFGHPKYKDGNMACNKLVANLHSGFEASSHTHLLLDFDILAQEISFLQEYN